MQTMSILLCLFLVAASVMIHYEALRFMNDCSRKIGPVPERAKVLAAMVGAMLSHLLQIGVFGLAYYVMRDKFGMGGFTGTFDDSLWGFVYFSSETYTTLGFGDIYPTGSLRMVCGIESLVGLLMVSWTASFTYLEMRRHW
jgi:ion channel